MSFRIGEPTSITVANMTTNATDATPAWNSGTTYALAAVVQRNKRICVSQQSGNTNHDPATDVDEDWWKDIGPTNDWAMFDDQIDTQTTRADNIAVSIALTERIDQLGLFKVDAASVHVEMLSGATVVYDENFSMVNYAGIANYWDHFFNRVTRKRRLIVNDLPIFSGLTLNVTINAPGGDASVGHFVADRSRTIGETAKGATLGYLGLSKFEADEFGHREVVKRTGKRRGDFDVWIKAAYIESTADLVNSYDGVPVLISATDKYKNATGIYGLILQAPITISYDDFAVMRFSVEEF